MSPTSYKAFKVLSGNKILSDVFINVRDGIIESIEADPAFPENSMDLGRETVVYPGFINTHTHSFQSLLRGGVNDCNLQDFLNIVYKACADYKPEDIYKGALISFEEMARNGITTVCDFFYVNGHGNHYAKEVIRAAKEIGIRLTLARTIMDDSKLPASIREDLETGLARYRELRSEFDDYPMVKIILAPHSVYYSSEEVIAAVKKESETLNQKWHMHYADSQWTRDYAQEHFKTTELQHLAKQDLVDGNFVGIHGIWADQADIELMAKHGVSISHNPRSNQFIGEPVPRIWEMLQAGVCVGIGTDGAASNPSLNVSEEIKQALLAQKSNHRDPCRLGLQEGLKIATDNSAEIVGYKTGRLEKGYFADFLVCDLNHPSLYPIENLVSHFIYSFSPQSLKKVIVHGTELAAMRFGQDK